MNWWEYIVPSLVLVGLFLAVCKKNAAWAVFGWCNGISCAQAAIAGKTAIAVILFVAGALSFAAWMVGDWKVVKRG